MPDVAQPHVLIHLRIATARDVKGHLIRLSHQDIHLKRVFFGPVRQNIGKIRQVRRMAQIFGQGFALFNRRTRTGLANHRFRLFAARAFGNYVEHMFEDHRLNAAAFEDGEVFHCVTFAHSFGS